MRRSPGQRDLRVDPAPGDRAPAEQGVDFAAGACGRAGAEGDLSVVGTGVPVPQVNDALAVGRGLQVALFLDLRPEPGEVAEWGAGAALEPKAGGASALDEPAQSGEVGIDEDLADDQPAGGLEHAA